MAGEKEVVLKLRAVVDPRSGQSVQQLATQLSKASAEIVSIERSGTARMVNATATGLSQGNQKIGGALKSRVAQHKAHYDELLALDKQYQKARQDLASKISGAIGKARASGSGDDAAAVAELAKQGESLVKEHEKIQREISRIQAIEAGKRTGTEIKAQREQEQAARESLAKRLADYKKSKAAEEKELARCLAKAKREQDRAYADEVKAQEKAAKEAERIRTRQQKEQEKAAAEEAKIQSKRIRDEERAAESRRQSSEKARMATRELLETAGESSEAIMKVTRGVVALGLVGEKDLDKVKDKLLQMQAAFDLVSGGVKIILNLEKAMNAYRTATLAAAAAQGTLSAAQNAGAAQGLAGALGRSLGGKLSGLRGMIAGGGAQAAATVATGAAGSVAGKVAGGAAATAGGAAATTTAGGTFLGGVVAPLAALTVAVVGLKEVIQNGGKFRQDSTIGKVLGGASRIGGRVDQYLGLDTAARRAADSTDATEKLAKKSEQIQADNARDYEARIAAEQEILQLKRQQKEYAESEFDLQLEAMEPIQKREAVAKAIADQEEHVRKLMADAAAIGEEFGELRKVREEEVINAQERSLELAKMAQSVEKEIIQQRKEETRQKLSAEKEVLQTLEQQLKTEQSKYRSAEEKFAFMNKAEQQEVLRINSKMQAGKDLTGDELQKLNDFRDLPGFKDKFDSTIKKNADAAGFGAIGGDAAKSLTELEGKVKTQKDVVAKLETTLNVTIEADAKKLEKALADQTDKAVKEFFKPILERIFKVEGDIQAAETRMRNRFTGG